MSSPIHQSRSALKCIRIVLCIVYFRGCRTTRETRPLFTLTATLSPSACDRTARAKNSWTWGTR
eukprot:2355691-Pyramimonas_sp.AAC.3